MATTVQNVIDATQPYILYSPVTAGAGGIQPAVGIMNEIQNTILNPPFTWPWNRAEDSSTMTVAGTQDYTINITNFGFLERCTLVDSKGNAHEVKDVYNNLSRGIANVNTPARPNGVAVKSVIYGTSVSIRFMGAPDQVYTIVLTYQKLVVPLTALTGSPAGTLVIPDQMIDVINSLFIGESFALTNDHAAAQQYRARGIATLLAKAEGLTEMQINAFLEQYWMRNRQQQYSGQGTTQGTQGRGV
jgi:hypothetical protein